MALMTPEEHDELVRLAFKLDEMKRQADEFRKSIDERLLVHHDRANQLQKDYFEWEKRLRWTEDAIKDIRTTAKINWAWWAAISSLVGIAANFVFHKARE